jgi:D-sedoheptulose 7-phosphate isomerase
VTMHIQQAHLALEHIFCMLVERDYFGHEQAAPAETPAVVER